MLPIPAFNPGDTTTYPNGNGVINVGAADAGSKMLLYNESPFNINIDFLNGNQSILHAWEARYWTLDGDTRQVEWDINSTLNVTSSPISLVIGELYGAREKLEGTYPMGLIRQTNVGNPGGIVSSASTIINDGNALLQIIEATLSGHASSDVIVNNDGSYTLKGAGLLAAVGVLTHVLGNLTVDGTTTHTGATTQTGVLTAPAANIFGAIGILTHILGTLTVDQAATLSGVVTAPAANVFGAIGILTHILGTLTVDGASTLTGAANFSSTITMPNATYLQMQDHLGTARGVLATDASDNTIARIAGASGQFQVLSQLASTVMSVDANSLNIASAKIADGSGNNMIDWTVGGMVARGQRSAHNRFTYQGDGTNVDWFINAQGASVTGSASATVNHLLKQFGASIAPNNFIMNPSTGGGSQTFGFNTITATQVNVVIGATNAYSFFPIKW